jgi:protein involved in polysaccharide export with SLBB domain
MKKYILFIACLSFLKCGWTFQEPRFDSKIESPQVEKSHTKNTYSSSRQKEKPLNRYDHNKGNFSSLGFVSPRNADEKTEGNRQENESVNQPSTTYNLPIFGQNLFGSQCNKLHSAHFFNPDYRITAGDHINMKMWGAFQFDKELEVDAQGNIFIPEVGPIKVEGTSNTRLNSLIKYHIKTIFKHDVNSYADLVTSQPIQIYVTGFVNSPGLYDGLSSDSVIYFLCAADGINPKEGSYRSINIVRGGRIIHEIDLYQFLLHGLFAPLQLHQGDTIVVTPQKNTILVDGEVKNTYQYEWQGTSLSVETLRKWISIKPSATYLRIQRNKGSHPEYLYKSLREASFISLESGDHLTFVSDKSLDQIIINIKGQVEGHHQIVLNKGTRLDELIKKLVFKKEANKNTIQLFRESVAVQQKESIDATLSRFERKVLTSTPQTDEDAKIQVAQSDLLMRFIEEAKDVKMKGQVVLGPKNTWHRIHLENNDIINVPALTSVVTVSGEVMNAISIEEETGHKIHDYIKAAGGLTDRADPSQILLIKQSGKVHLLKYNGYHTANPIIEGGDEIIILSKVTDEGWRKTGMLSKIAYQIAIAARVALML